MPLDATVGGAESNSYVTETEAQAYFEGRLDGQCWFSAPPERREQALVFATFMLENENWLGHQVTPEQRLAWPRAGVRVPNNFWIFYETDEIPNQVKLAQMEMAYQYSEQGIQDQSGGSSSEGINSLSVGGVSASFSNQSFTAKSSAVTFNPLVSGLLSGLTSGQVVIWRG